ncbi:hypothetical protein GH714_026873 [Hevea brasiliensis]|uniref:non-specific serine/threonine protein kinase n=1 Tax=Hevea brasiliensis TaxID=3981 RepID=A0A6A6L493_HEVBR|nr:hypothetical protein GH714_026873 [Hevea brasiliensis]
MSRTQKLSLLFHFLLSFPPLQVISSPRTQAEALIHWRNSLSSSPPSLNSWYLTNLNNLCNWTAISCDPTGAVSKINLSNLNITGTLNQFNFSSFANIISFDVKNNNIEGTIPAAICSLSKLTYLDLSVNYFSGNIPVELGRLTELLYLSLYDNNLNGTIPYQLSNLQKVWYLDLGANFLENSDWSKFSSMPSLMHLSFYHNELTLGFPDFISNCRNLTFLDLSYNRLTGMIPEWAFTNLGRTKYFNLTDNLFQGPLSSNISKLSNLKHLRLQNNGFRGQIPESIGSLSGLEILELYNNSFAGNIPSSLGQLRDLELLDLRMNALNSTIPPELGLCTNLSDLALAANQLSGNLPLFLSNLTKMVHVEIGQLSKLNLLFLCNNTLSGSIPPEIGNLKDLQSLDFSENQLSGSIPPTLWKLKNLRVMSLFSNNISGIIPPDVGNMTSLVTLDLSTNQLEGELPQTIAHLSSLESINLLTNKFSGSIPRDFGKYGILKNASFSNNSFAGELPAELCSGLALEQLTVNDNNFTGSLPTCLRNCSGLTRVRLDGNQFTGNITNAFGVHPKLVFISLSGRIPTALSGMISLQSFDFSFNELTGPIPAGGRFQNASAEAFVGNSVSLSLLAISICIVAVLISCRKREPHDEEIKGVKKYERSESMIWEREGKFTLGDFVKATDDFNEKYCIGKGGFGTVYKAVLATGKVVAVKKLNISDSSDIPAINRLSFENEIRMLTEVRHRNIIKFHGVALACTSTTSEERPAMHSVAQELALRRKACLPEPLENITLSKLTAFQDITEQDELFILVCQGTCLPFSRSQFRELGLPWNDVQL